MFDLDRLTLGIPGKGRIKHLIIEFYPELNADLDIEETIKVDEKDKVVGIRSIHFAGSSDAEEEIITR